MALHRLPLVTAALLAGLLAPACGAPAPGSPSPAASPKPAPTASAPPAPIPTPSPTPSPTPVAELSGAALRYLLLDQFAPISWCDPDFYPIAHGDEQQLAEQRLAEIQADEPTYLAIANRLGLDASASPTAEETLAIYREWKQLNAVALQPFDGSFAFDLISESNVGQGLGVRSAGTIDGQGAISLALQEQAFLTACPICLARGTLIDTPDGAVTVENLRVGDLVWTLGPDGDRVAAPLALIGATPVPASHQVVHLVLDDGRALFVSPGHLTADGRKVGDLRAGDKLDGAVVVSAERVAYSGDATFDILPDGASGAYWANGVLLGSTLR